MSDPRFVRRAEIRCEDCDIRGDLHETGYPLLAARYRISACSGCDGHGAVPAPSRNDPYDGVDLADYYVQRRQQRADAARLVTLPRAARRRYLDLIRLESLMSAEPGS